MIEAMMKNVENFLGTLHLSVKTKTKPNLKCWTTVKSKSVKSKSEADAESLSKFSGVVPNT